MKQRALAALGLTMAGLASAQALQARDIDHDGRVDAWYDPQRRLSWLADANAAAGSPFDNGSRGDDGRMTRNAALSWAAWVDVAGVTGWRLPTLVDLGPPGCNAGYAGTDCGYNVDTTGSELAAMFHGTLGNLSAYDTGGQARPGVSGVDWGLVNAGPFVNLKNDAYWIGTPYPSVTVPMGWSFFTLDGRQVPFSHAAEMFAWAVHDGDVAPVPELPPAALLALGLSGLAGLGLWRRRAAAGLALAVGAAAAQAGTWAPPRTLDGPVAVSSPPEAPIVVADASGRTLVAWATAGALRWAEKRPGAAWTRAANAPGGAAIAGPLAAAAGRNGGSALAWTTVATRYTPSRLLVSLRPPGGRFAAPVEVGSFTAAGLLQLGIACSGEVTLVWQGPQGLAASRWAGDGGTGACDGRPGPGPWSTPVALAPVGAAWPQLAVADDGTALVAWQAGMQVQARRRDAGAWAAPATLSDPLPESIWGVQLALDARGRAAVAWLGGGTLRLARGDADGWQAPVALSPPDAAQGLALAGTAAGELLVAWQGIDGGGTGGVWQRSAGVDGLWSATTRLSAAGETPGDPSAAWAADGSVALVGWVDNGSNQARAAVRGAAGWARSTLGVGWWGGAVPVAAGALTAVAAWVIPTAGNPNAASVVARGWQ